MSILIKTTSYFKEAKEELKKVDWPTRKEVTNFTVSVIVASLIVAAFLGAFDFLFAQILNRLLLK